MEMITGYRTEPTVGGFYLIITRRVPCWDFEVIERCDENGPYRERVQVQGWDEEETSKFYPEEMDVELHRAVEAVAREMREGVRGGLL